jgi:hypothetical protein
VVAWPQQTAARACFCCCYSRAFFGAAALARPPPHRPACLPSAASALFCAQRTREEAPPRWLALPTHAGSWRHEARVRGATHRHAHVAQGNTEAARQGQAGGAKCNTHNGIRPRGLTKQSQ